MPRKPAKSKLDALAFITPIREEALAKVEEVFISEMGWSPIRVRAALRRIRLELEAKDKEMLHG